MKVHGIGVNLKKESNVFIPKYNGVYNMEYTKVKNSNIKNNVN